jgi:1-acyl-sn-glycerol-3-phosphate acyltransferase
MRDDRPVPGSGALRLRPALAKGFLRLTGWALEGARPTARSYLLIAAPHTTNWDLVYFLALAWAFGITPSWMGKHTLFRGPLGPVMRWLGGVPVQRARAGGLVSQMAQAFQRNPDLVLTVPPEGTRGRATHWKSGFYQIARAAKVPIVMGYLDYERRRGGLGPELVPGDDLRADMDEIRAFYADKRGKYPDRFGDVRLAEEEAGAGAS